MSENRHQRVGVVGDIHCESEVLERVLEFFSVQGIKTVLAVGDIVDGTGDANRVCSLLRRYDVATVSGNHDRWILADAMRDLSGATLRESLSDETLDWLAKLPKTLEFQTTRGLLLLCHGLGEDDLAGVRPEDSGYAIESNLPLQDLLKERRYCFVLNGHTHLPMVRTVEGCTIINAGTLDRRNRQVCSVVDFEQGKVQFSNINQDQICSAEHFSIL